MQVLLSRAAGAVAASIAGFAAHNLIEFGVRGLADLSAGFLPFVVLQLAILAAGWRAPPLRRGAWILLGITGALQFAGGVLTVLPLPFLPFVPEFTPTHVAAHVVYAGLQLPLLALLRR